MVSDARLTEFDVFQGTSIGIRTKYGVFHMPKQGAKQQVAVRIPLRQKAELECEAEQLGTSRSEYIRSILDNRHRVKQLANTVSRKNNRIETLEKQLNRRSHVEEKVDVLANRVESQQEREQRQLDREDALASAAPWTRFRWWATGTDPANTVDRDHAGENKNEA